MKKRQINVQLDDDVVARLTEIGRPYGNMSPNAMLAALGCELSRISNRPGELWHALGRIAGDGALELMPAERESLPATRKQVQPAISPGR